MNDRIITVDLFKFSITTRISHYLKSVYSSVEVVLNLVDKTCHSLCKAFHSLLIEVWVTDFIGSKGFGNHKNFCSKDKWSRSYIFESNQWLLTHVFLRLLWRRNNLLHQQKLQVERESFLWDLLWFNLRCDASSLRKPNNISKFGSKLFFIIKVKFTFFYLNESCIWSLTHSEDSD